MTDINKTNSKASADAANSASEQEDFWARMLARLDKELGLKPNHKVIKGQK